MNCLECRADNPTRAPLCRQCGASLRPARANLYLDNTDASLDQGHYDEAREHLAHADTEMALLSPEQRDKYLLTARAFWLQGSIFYSRGEMAPAKEELNLARAALEGRQHGQLLLADTLNKLGNVCYHQGEMDAAIEYYQHSSVVGLQAGSYGVASKATNNLGNISVIRGRVDEAVAYYMQALEMAKLAANATHLAQTYRTLASLHSHYGPFSRALEYANHALALRERIDNVDARCLVTCEAAAVFIKYGELDRAERYLREAAQLVSGSGGKLSEQTVALYMAQLMRHKGDHQAWFNYAMQAYNDASRLLKSDTALELALYYITQQDWTKARRHLRILKELAGYEPSTEDMDTLNRAQALLYSALGEWDEAEGYFQLVLASPTYSRYDIAITWREYAEMLTRRAVADLALVEQARAALVQAASLFRDLELPHQLAHVETMLTRLSIAALERTERR